MPNIAASLPPTLRCRMTGAQSESASLIMQQLADDGKYHENDRRFQ